MAYQKKVSVSLWIIQVLLAALFVFAGGMKLVVPAAVLAEQSGLPVAFLRFIGVAEVAGALGLILPGATRIAPVLTPLAAAGLVPIMIGAVALSAAAGGAGAAIVPAIVGVLTVAIAYGRAQIVPHGARD